MWNELDLQIRWLWCYGRFTHRTFVLEDPIWFPSAKVYREIRQRCYGVLFNCIIEPSSQPGVENIKIKEWCAYQGNNLHLPEYIPPLPLKLYFNGNKCRLPRIEDLWFKCTALEKMKMFWSILQVPMDFEVLLTVPKHQIVLVCVLNYLCGGWKDKPFLHAWEAAVFIAQALRRKNTRDLERLQAPRVDAVAVSLSALFIHGVTTVLMVLSTCDFPFPLTYAMPWNFFDGKLFHHFYVKATERRRPSICVSDLCRNQKGMIEEFYSILLAVTNNTPYDCNRTDWRNILTDFQSDRIQKAVKKNDLANLVSGLKIG